MFLNTFFNRISRDFKHRELLPLKILFFVHASTLLVLYPYLTIHMRELGINVEETAIMSAVTPVVIIIMPPLAGMIADKIGNFKLLLSISSATGGIVALFLLMVPVGRVIVTYPRDVEMVLGSYEDPNSLMMDVSQYGCEPLHPYAYDVDMKIRTCGFACDWSKENGLNTSLPLDEALSYAVKIRSPIEGATEVFRYPLNIHDRPTECKMQDQNTIRNITNNERYKTALRRISESMLFFPTDGMYDFECKRINNGSDVTCTFGSNETLSGGSISSKNGSSFIGRITPGENVAKNVTRDVRTLSFTLSSMSLLKQHGEKRPVIKHVDNFANGEDEISVELFFQQADSESESIGLSVQLEQCSAKCLVTSPRKQLCSNLKEEIELDPKLTFWSYLVVRVFIGIVGGTAFAMFEGAVIAILREHEADYGLQRIYGSIGGMISSPLSGLLIDYASRNKGYTDFRPAFYLYAVLKVISGALMMTINLEFKAPATNLMDDVVKVLKNVEIVALFFAVFVLGSCWGYIESFLFWLLQDLGASSSLMGITVTVGGIAGIPLLVLSGPIIDKIGHANVLFIGFLFYGIRLFGYSMIFNPWMCLIFEALEGVTTSLAFTAAVTYTARLSTTTTDTSIQGLMGGLYYGVGRGSGSLVGGYLMKIIGTRPTYKVFACMAVVTGCIYFLFNKLYLMKRPQVEGNDICKKQPKIKNDPEKPPKEPKRNEKMPLKDSKSGVNMYVENAYKNNLEPMNDKQTNGIDNPVFVENELTSVELNDKKKSYSIELQNVDSNK